MCYSAAMEYYSTIKRNRALSHAVTRTNLENLIQTECLLLYDYIYMKCPESANLWGKKVG
jgi:hypothetical protein